MDTVFYTGENLKNIPKIKRTLHGKRAHPLYARWQAMKGRCLNKSNSRYYDYGGRGIGICKEWLIFINYYNDLIKLYRYKMDLDRINNNRGYCKDNCQFVTSSKNSSNKRSPRPLMLRGVHLKKYRNSLRYIASMRVAGTTYHLGCFDTEKEAHYCYVLNAKEWWGRRSVI